MSSTDQLGNITWDNSEIYQSLSDPQIEKDLKTIEETTNELLSYGEMILEYLQLLEKNEDVPHSYEKFEKFLLLEKQNVIMIRSLAVYASCFAVVDSKNTDAKALSSKVMKYSTEFGKSTKPMHVLLSRLPEEFVNTLFERENVKEFKFNIQQQRKQKDFLLPVGEEKLLTGFATDGLHAWGKLYTDLAASIKVDVQGTEVGLAKAASNLRGKDRNLREASYRAIEGGWETHQESAAAILNAINGWRNENFKVRSNNRDMHYLDASCHTARISRKTLDTLMQTAYDRVEVGREANRLIAKALNEPKMSPWDNQAPCPFSADQKPVPFKEAMTMITDAFHGFDPKMAEFAQMMADKRWIDSLPTENRSPGAFCTKFTNKREPRVFLTYNGNMGDIITLAHELGHAYHNWVLKDVPLGESVYSMTLAETASVFAETLVREHILKNSKDREAKLQILWQELVSASAFLVNIPTRFDFEVSLVEGRKEKFLRSEELCNLMVKAGEKWYGDTLSEMPKYFWASKLHFSISGLSFYNYPYLFGYLFSLGIYNQREARGEGFVALYEEILKDTGKMMAEDLVQKNLSMNIESADFWNGSINQVEKSIKLFANTL
jgi:oligoendopeptidase F